MTIPGWTFLYCVLTHNTYVLELEIELKRVPGIGYRHTNSLGRRRRRSDPGATGRSKGHAVGRHMRPIP